MHKNYYNKVFLAIVDRIFLITSTAVLLVILESMNLKKLFASALLTVAYAKMFSQNLSKSTKSSGLNLDVILQSEVDTIINRQTSSSGARPATLDDTLRIQAIERLVNQTFDATCRAYGSRNLRFPIRPNTENMP